MKILMTNDDGIHAPGLHFAWRALLNAGHEIFVCVPDRPRSACSHGITMHKPLRVKFVETEEGTAAVSNGLPADCIPLALSQIMDWKPDLIISGINLGPNLGDDVHYSGTVAGAMEGMINGIPSMAISLAEWEKPSLEWETSCHFCVELAAKIPSMKLPANTFLNVNVPNLPLEKMKGIKITVQSGRRYKGEITARKTPFHETYYWRGGQPLDGNSCGDTDVAAIQNGYVSVTPLQTNLTNRTAADALKVLLSTSIYP